MMLNNFLIQQNTVFSELQFMLAGQLYGRDIHKIFDTLMKSGLDNNSYGFWVMDIPNDVVLYSPKFRQVLEYSGESDFPNTPAAWMQAMDHKDLPKALDNYNKHIASNGDHKFIQRVRYHKKYNGHIDVICHGKVAYWEGSDPITMIGIHLNTSGVYCDTVTKFSSLLDEDVKFADMLKLKIGDAVALTAGCNFKMIHKDAKVFNGKCNMDQYVELSIHHHSDFDESFKVLSGSIVDKCTGLVLSVGDQYTIKRNVSHNIQCLEDCTIDITGIKVV